MLAAAAATPIRAAVTDPSVHLELVLEHLWLVRTVHLRREQVLLIDATWKRHATTAEAKFKHLPGYELAQFLEQRLNAWSRDRDLAVRDLEHAQDRLDAFRVEHPQFVAD
jgi:hypothetical protein